MTRRNLWQRILDRWAKDRHARHKGERDAPAGLGDPTSRDVGGGSDAPTQDKHSTTGTTSSGSFVGRAGGDEAGDVGPSGGEVRAGQTDLSGQGAARKGTTSSGSTS